MSDSPVKDKQTGNRYLGYSVKPEDMPGRCPFADGASAFVPPKPNHRPKKLSLANIFKTHDLDVLEAYPAAAYSWYIGKFSAGFTDVYTVNDLACMQRMMVDRVEDYPKSRYLMRALYPLLGNGIFSTSGEKWAGQREKIDPALGHLHLKRAFPAMRSAARAMERRIARKIATGAPIDLEPEFSNVTADAIFRVMFSIPLQDDMAQSIFDCFQTFQKTLTGLQMSDFTSLPDWMPKRKSKAKSEGEKAAANLRDVIRRIVTARLDETDPPEDMLSVILGEYRKDASSTALAVDDLVEELVDQMSTFFLAGHETLASAMTWASYLLANSPAEEARMRAEIHAVIGEDPDERITFAHVRKLDFTRAVFRETLRLYPSIPYYPREAAADDKLRSHVVKPGNQCSIIPWFIQRHHHYWREPDAFIPERFMPGNLTKDERRAYIPFGHGPRVCPGAAFATIEAGLILATLYRRFTFTSVKGHVVTPLARLTLRTKHGMLMHGTDLHPQD